MIDFPTEQERSAEAQRLLDGLSPTWVAQRMTRGSYVIGKATVRLWRNGNRTPDLEDLLRLVDATQRPLSPLLRARIFGDGDPPESSGRQASA